MANTNVSFGEAKSICNSLEKSPSCNNMKSSPIYHGGSKAASKHSTPGKFGHKGVTGGKSRTNKRPSKSPYAE
jgi:hypothetical protein